MAFNHVGKCDCPIGCCDCGPETRNSHVFVFLENNEYRIWGMKSLENAKHYAFSDLPRWKNSPKKWVFKLGTKPWERFKKINNIGDPK